VLVYPDRAVIRTGLGDPRAAVPPALWQRVQHTVRHLFTHQERRVDAKFLAKVPSSTAAWGSAWSPPNATAAPPSLTRPRCATP
jgi:hypothetical protein